MRLLLPKDWRSVAATQPATTEYNCMQTTHYTPQPTVLGTKQVVPCENKLTEWLWSVKTLL